MFDARKLRRKNSTQCILFVNLTTLFDEFDVCWNRLLFPKNFRYFVICNKNNVIFQAEAEEDKVPLEYHNPGPVKLGHPDPALVAQAADVLAQAKRPLVIVGKGAAYGRAEDAVTKLIESTNLPFLPTPMGMLFKD